MRPFRFRNPARGYPRAFLFPRSLRESVFADILHQFTATGSNYRAVFHYENPIGRQRFHEGEIVRNDKERAFVRTQGCEEFRHHFERVDVEPGIDFVQNYELRIQKFQLEKLDAAFFPSRETHVQFAIEKRFRNAERFAFLRDGPSRDERRKRPRVGILALDFRVQNRAEVFGKFHSADFWNVLKRKEYSLRSAFFWGKSRYRFAVEEHFSSGYGIFRVSGDGERERRFSGTVLSKKITNRSCGNHRFDVFQYVFPFGANREILDFEHWK